jgi:hypothetical protein
VIRATKYNVKTHMDQWKVMNHIFISYGVPKLLPPPQVTTPVNSWILLFDLPVRCPYFWHPLGCKWVQNQLVRTAICVAICVVMDTSGSQPRLYFLWWDGTGSYSLIIILLCFTSFFQLSPSQSYVGSVSFLSPEIHTRQLYACTALAEYECRGMKLKTNGQLKTEWPDQACYLSQQTVMIKYHRSFSKHFHPFCS